MSSVGSWTLIVPTVTPASPSTASPSSYVDFTSVEQVFFPARSVQVVNGDAVLTASGDLQEAAEPIAEEVAFSLNTILGSFGGQATLGNGIISVRVFNNTSYVQIRDAVDRALLPMVISKTIRDVSVTPHPRMNGGVAVNAYTVTFRPTGVVDR